VIKKINNQNTNNCPVIPLVNGNQEGKYVVSNSNQASDQRSMNVSTAHENVSVATPYRMK
jgi:hypothetical protein